MGSEPPGLCQLRNWTTGGSTTPPMPYNKFINQRETPDAQATPQRQTALPAQRR